MSERVNRLLKPHNIKLGHKPTNTLRNALVHLKDKVETIDATDVVYKINCKNCQKVYIGETGKNLKFRIDEHKSNVRKFYNNSLIFQHVSQTHHSIDWSGPEILTKCSNVKKRKFLESCHSACNIDSYNRSQDIPDVYLSEIKEILQN